MTTTQIGVAVLMSILMPSVVGLLACLLLDALADTARERRRAEMYGKRLDMIIAALRRSGRLETLDMHCRYCGDWLDLINARGECKACEKERRREEQLLAATR